MECKVSPEEVKRVKGMGFLWDKRTPDTFNARVITKNGKITAEQHRAIAQACEQFGSGEVTMTVRLTLEIQGVKYENIQPLVDFLAAHGLHTGGTGKRVRPVVSCKGTTCQYGLIDTFALSEKIHERFYEGMRGVTLPHKFKIAVGGCPNNCVKPDLNDIGVIGQRIPTVYLDKCRGCKKCRVEAACPIHTAHVEEGKIVLHLFAEVKEVLGDDQGVNGVLLKSTNGKSDETINVDGLFIAIGHSPNTKIFADELTLEGGYIVTQGTGHHAATATNIEGVFAAGDCQDPVYRQAVTSAATGCMAALDAQRYLESLE